MTRLLPIRPLERNAFLPFGEIISPDTATRSFEINAGLATRHYDLATLDLADNVGRAILSVFSVHPNPPGEFAVDILERHPLGSQGFLPLGEADWIVIVAPDESRDAPGAPVAFRPGPGQGVNIGRGVWHYPLVSRVSARFLVIDGGVRADNLETCRLQPPLWHVSLSGPGTCVSDGRC